MAKYFHVMTKTGLEYECVTERGGGLMIRVLDCGSRCPGSRPGRGHCVVFLGKTLYSRSASPTEEHK